MREKYHAIDEVILERYCQESEPEGLQLDFKTIKGNLLRSEDDRRNLSKAISGFGNSVGGIIIWGVDTKKGNKSKDEPDTASNLVPIEDINTFVAKLEEMTAKSYFPHQVYVENQSIPSAQDSTKGYAKTLVGMRESDPIRAEFADKKYYKRSGDSFIAAEHYELRDMFGIRRPPILKLTVGAVIGDVIRGRTELQFKIPVYLENAGRFSAVSPFVRIYIPKPTTWDDTLHPYLGRLGGNAEQSSIVLGGNSTTVLHPGFKIYLGQLSYVIQIEAINPSQIRPKLYSRQLTIDKLEELNLRFEIGSYDLSMNTQEFKIELEVLTLQAHRFLDELSENFDDIQIK